jgi:hypothetical protein
LYEILIVAALQRTVQKHFTDRWNRFGILGQHARYYIISIVLVVAASGNKEKCYVDCFDV